MRSRSSTSNSINSTSIHQEAVPVALTVEVEAAVDRGAVEVASGEAAGELTVVVGMISNSKRMLKKKKLLKSQCLANNLSRKREERRAALVRPFVILTYPCRNSVSFCPS